MVLLSHQWENSLLNRINLQLEKEAFVVLGNGNYSEFKYSTTAFASSPPASA